jgi:hypothetical protein
VSPKTGNSCSVANLREWTSLCVGSKDIAIPYAPGTAERLLSSLWGACDTYCKDNRISGDWRSENKSEKKKNTFQEAQVSGTHTSPCMGTAVTRVTLFVRLSVGIKTGDTPVTLGTRRSPFSMSTAVSPSREEWWLPFSTIMPRKESKGLLFTSCSNVRLIGYRIRR